MKGPLGLPDGSVRSIIAVIIVLALVFFVAKAVSIPDQYWQTVNTVVVFYFLTRMNQDNKNGGGGSTPPTAPPPERHGKG